MAWTSAVYYRARDGSEPVSDYIDKLAVKKQVAIDLQIDRLNDRRPNDPDLPFPQSSQVRGKLRELRCHYGSELHRILYRRASGNLFVLLHAFRKDTKKIPEKHIALAEARWEEFTARMNARPRKPPRAAGGNAP